MRVTKLNVFSRSSRSGVVLALLISLSTTACAMENEPFDSEKWSSEGRKSIDDNARWSMADQVNASIRPGMTRTEVIQLLGKPDETKEFSDATRDIYHVGRPWGEIDDAWYELKYVEQTLSSIHYQRG